MLSFGCLCLLLGVGYYLRNKVGLFRKLYLPASVVAGLLGLILIQTFSLFDTVSIQACYSGWSKIPGLLINIVFACLFLGMVLPKLSKICDSVGRQLAYGQIVAWGQYVIGCAVVLLLLKPLFNVPELFAGIMPVGFEGGHGTAAGMGPVFNELGWAAGQDLALASATGGMISAIIVGMAFINWAKKRGYVSKKLNVEQAENIETAAVSGGKDRIESLSLHFVVIGVAILLGVLMQKGLLFVASSFLSGKGQQVFMSFPLFPLCMIGGIFVQICLTRFNKTKYIKHRTILKIQNIALDFLIVAAIATIKVQVIAQMWIPLVILILAGILWNVFCLVLLARRVFKDAWFERAIAELGQSMGVTATGLLLLRVVDPNYETPAAEAFAGKQLFHEPFMGGGLWTSMAIPLLALWGGWVVFFISLSAICFWSIIIFFIRIKQK